MPGHDFGRFQKELAALREQMKREWAEHGHRAANVALEQVESVAVAVPDVGHNIRAEPMATFDHLARQTSATQMLSAVWGNGEREEL